MTVEPEIQKTARYRREQLQETAKSGSRLPLSTDGWIADKQDTGGLCRFHCLALHRGETSGGIVGILPISASPTNFV